MDQIISFGFKSGQKGERPRSLAYVASFFIHFIESFIEFN